MDHWKIPPELGVRGVTDKLVSGRMSAIECGSGKLPVLGTPAMIAGMEETAMNAIAAALNDGYETVGTYVCVDHIKPTPMGAMVTFGAELVKIEGRSLTFKVFAEDSSGLIGQGTHRRFVIHIEHFMRQLD